MVNKIICNYTVMLLYMYVNYIFLFIQGSKGGTFLENIITSEINKYDISF